jgi:hypothetical protein
MNARLFPALAALALLGGCATSFQLTLMPRDSGKLYYGTADETASGDGRISITIEDKTYAGTYVQVTPERTSAYVAGGYGYGRRGGYGMGGIWSIDNPEGGSAKALLQSPDGSGLRCELRSGGYGSGGGLCRDDKGREYDVQLRAKASS